MWRPIDTEFFGPKLPVAIADIGGGVGLRTMLESLGCVVHRHGIGTPTDFLNVIGHGAAIPPYLIIEGHGTEEGLHFGEYGGPIDTSMLDGECMPARAIHGRVNLGGCTVVNLTCLGGEEAMARAFLSGGIKAYIGCRDWVDGSAMTLFAYNFFYNVTERKLSDRDAWHHAVFVTDHEETDQISFWHADGREERFVRQSNGYAGVADAGS